MRYVIAAAIAALVIAHFVTPKPEGKCLSWLDGECIKMSFVR